MLPVWFKLSCFRRRRPMLSARGRCLAPLCLCTAAAVSLRRPAGQNWLVWLPQRKGKSRNICNLLVIINTTTQSEKNKTKKKREAVWQLDLEYY